MTIQESTRAYEQWLRTQLHVIEADLRLKHEEMRNDVFSFFRATYYRWAQIWPEVCVLEKGAPRVLAVGDLHVENFGTWRDAEGRLVWGINDFDEAWRMDYTNDLVRLVASAMLSGINGRMAAKQVLKGYRASLKESGRALVLAELNLDLRIMAAARLRDPGKYWRKLAKVPTWRGKLPHTAKKCLMKSLPQHDAVRFIHRVSGLGSLGRERYAVVAVHHGGQVAREAKTLAISACAWAESGGKPRGDAPILYQKIVNSAVRCHDPFLEMDGKWILRRLAPDCSRIELSELPELRDEAILAEYMGRETANVHLGSADAKELRRDLKNRGDAAWLVRDAETMVRAIRADWKDWKRSRV